jgi:phosphotransferase system, enzyme I, PtsP
MTGGSSGTAGGSRALLRSLRDLMTGSRDTQASLDTTTRQVASAMVADVCSIYLRRIDGTLELCATEGLQREAVHRTRMKPKEGLVGLVAEAAQPVALSDAPRHPRFSYRPETGEDPYQSFLGVPILRAGRLIGVLVVQNRRPIVWDGDEIEILQTIAGFIGELVLRDGPDGQLAGFEIKPTQPARMKGRMFAGGLAIGSAFLHEPVLGATRLLSDNPQEEEVRLQLALTELRKGLERLLTGDVESLGGVPFEVLETFLLLSQDRGWERRLADGVRAGLTAEASVEQVRSEHRARLANAKDGYLRDRLQDLEELDNRLLRHLSGATHPTIPDGGEAVLVARDIGPAELLEYGAERIRAVLLEAGSPSGHAAIVARAMGLPMIGQLEGLLSKVETGDSVIVDATERTAYLRPDSAVSHAFATRFQAQSAERAQFAALKDTPCVTRDGHKISLLLNAGLQVDMDQLDQTGAEGVGLFRTEFQFMVADTMPRLETQTLLYARVMNAASGRPVTFRTLDLGSDKMAAFMPKEREENPAMGWRAVRIGLDRVGLSRYQLRALVRAAEGRPLRVMFPLVTVVEEFRKAKELLLRELDWALSHGRPIPQKLEVGAMVEAPALAWQTAEIAAEADFLSVGTNDLLQFFFAADRGSARMAERYDILSRPALGLLSHIVREAGDTPVSVCGEHAGRPLEAMALIGLGYRRLSMPASGIGPVKRMALALDAGAVAALIEQLMHDRAADVRGELRSYAECHDIAA